MRKVVQVLCTALPLVVLLVAVLLSFTGCASSSETDNLSGRPWNAPKGWETGLPSGMYDQQQRR